MMRTTRHDPSVLAPRRPAAALVAVLATAVLVAGCTGADPEPESTASELPLPASVTASPSATVSPEPSPEPSDEVAAAGPERPAVMDKKDAEGAAAAAKYILSLEQPMMVTGDTAEWEARSHRSCEYCESRLDQAKTIAKRGDVFTGGDVEVVVDKVYQRDVVTGIWPMDITLTEAATTITGPDDEVIFEMATTSAERRAELGLRDGEWLLVELAPIPEG
ncbi:hypothetical protein BCE75_10417 [Isoptericola sp. CG 20/1183]|uniref:DUF6318 domain-containing protein n=1 Tax=Isoptericola halotolerans TaxID=300560 RepID=A0ABX5EF77_9MICO|nr:MULTISPECIES: DUF6318 family protein [Isoptericola]PRZ07805.1 hypothetical protein BCL65_104248 [Isoptericola halotolerans]PRZ07836.1 hypothetical protein BCE75_10417 [Isoptericola sp. CG 20/1183]